MPAVAALAGLFIARDAPRGGPARPRALRATAAVIGFLLALAGAGTLYVFQSSGKVYALNGAAFVGGVGAVGGVVALVLAALNRSRAAFAAVLVALVTLNWAFVVRVLPSFERYKPVPGLSTAIRERAVPGDKIVHYNVALPSMVFYLAAPHRHALRTRGVPGAAARRAAPYTPFFRRATTPRCCPRSALPTCVLERRPTVNVKLKAVLARDPLPEVLLITNRCQ